MKKRSKSLLIPLFSAFLFSAIFAFTGCENFLSGDEAIEEIERVISYANAQSYVIHIKADENSGTITSVKDKAAKVTDEFDVAFQVAQGYRFIKWVAVNYDDNSISMDSYVKIAKPESLETKVKFLKESDSIQIKPLCEQLLVVSKSSVDDVESVYPRDTPIIIDFNKPISKDNDLSKISITIAGLAESSQYFNEPELKDNKLYFFAKSDKLIPVPQNTTRTVNVTVPTSIFYEGNYGKENLNAAYTVSYTIDSSTTEKSTITFSYDDEIGTLKVDGETAKTTANEYSIGQTITLSYKRNKDYYFNGWQITDPEGKETKGIEISYADNEEHYGLNESTNLATATILIISPVKNITVSPSVTEIPTASIQFLMDDEKAGTLKVNGVVSNGLPVSYKKDTVITVTYKKNADFYFKGWSNSESESEKVKISYPDNEDYSGYDEITGVSTINVTIMDGATNVIIKPITPAIPKAGVSFVLEDNDSGVLKVDGVISTGESKSYNKDKEVQVTFRKNSNYYFEGWMVTADNGTETSVELKDASYDEATSTASVTVVIKGEGTNVIIKPKAPKIPWSYITVKAEHGRISPEGKKDYKELVETTITYDADKDYCFTKWNVKTKAGGDASSFFDISDEYNTSATFTLKKDPPAGVEFEIYPTCVERAQYLSWTPLYSGVGVLRDSRVQIMFDHDMDPESIYYTTDEISDLKSDYGNDCLLEDKDGNVYGYTVGGKKYYKNITIVDSSNRNLLDYYGAPYFYNGNVLIIPTSIIQNGKETVSNAPSSGTDIVVTIDEKVFYREKTNNIAVKMSGAKKWNYLVNGDTDNIKPTVKVTLYTSDENFSATAKDFDTDDGKRIKSLADESTLLTNKADWSNYSLKDGKLRVYGEFSDAGSGVINTFKTTVLRVSDGYSAENYEPVELEPQAFTKGSASKYYFGDISGAVCKPAELDFSDETKFADGFYKVEFSTEDNNGNIGVSDGNYYFLLDRIEPDITKPAASATENTITWSWGSTSEDYKRVSIIQNDDVNNIITAGNTDFNKVISSLDKGTKYNYTFNFEDYAGNVTQYQLTKNTLPGKIVLNAPGKPTSAGIPLTWSYPVNNSTITKTRIYYEKGAAPTQSSSYVDVEKQGDDDSTVITGLDLGSTYNFIAYAIDDEGNLSYVASDSKEQKTLPEAVSNVNALTTASDTIKLTWDNPASNYDHTKICYSTDNTFPVASTATVDTVTNETDNVISGLSVGRTYYFRLYTIDEDGNESSCVEIHRNTAPGKITGLSFPEGGAYNKPVVPSAWTLPAGTETTISRVRIYYSETDITSTDGLRYADSTDTTKETLSLTPSVNTMKPGYKYYIKAVAIDDEGNKSELSDSVNYIVYPRPVDISKISTPDVNSRKITWTESDFDDSVFTGVTYTVEQSVDGKTYTQLKDNISGVECTVTGIPVDAKYYFRVNAVYTTGATSVPVSGFESRDDGVTVNAVAAPAVSISGTTATLTWTKAEGFVDGYEIFYGTSDVNSQMIDAGSCSKDNTQKIITGLTAGTKYYFKVATYVNSFASINATNVAVSNAVSEYAKPNAAVLTSVTTTNYTAKLTWTAPESGNYTAYRVIRSGNDEATVHYDVNKGSTEYTITGLKSGAKYSYCVLTYSDKYVNTTASNAALSNIISEYTKVNTPAISGVTVSGTSATVNWTVTKTTSDIISGFKVYYGTSDNISSMTLVASCGNTERSKTISGLTAGTKYYFRVVAYAGTYSSYNSSNATVSAASNKYVKPGAATISSVTTTGSTATVKWSAPDSGNYSGYIVYCGTTNSLSNMSTSVTVSNKATTSCTISGLASGTKYYFIVVTYADTWSGNKTADNVSASSSYGKYTTVPSATISSGTVDAYNKITLNWTKPSGNFTKYRLYYGTSNSISNMTCYGEYANTTTQAVVTGLSGNTSYYFRLVTYSGTWSSVTAENSAVGEYIYKKTAAPKPTSVTASVGTDYVDLSWTYASGNHYRFDIYYKDVTDGDTEWKQGSGYSSGSGWYSSSNSEVTSTKLQNASGATIFIPGHEYKIAVFVGNEDWWDQKDTSAAYITTVVTKPLVPSTFTAVSTSQTSTKISWTYNTSVTNAKCNGVILHYKKSTASGWSSVKLTGTTKTFTGLTAGGTYNYYLVPYVVDSNGKETEGNATTGRIIYLKPNSPSNLKAYGSNNTTTLSWTAPSSGEYDSYVIYYCTSPTNLFNGTAVGTTSSSSDIPRKLTVAKGTTTTSIGMYTGSTWYFKIVAVTGTVESDLNTTTACAFNWVNPGPTCTYASSLYKYSVKTPSAVSDLYFYTNSNGYIPRENVSASTVYSSSRSSKDLSYAKAIYKLTYGGTTYQFNGYCTLSGL